jgi:hypothetical protein
VTVLLAMVTLCVACSSTRQLDIRDDASVAEFNREHASRGGEVFLKGGLRYEAAWVRVDPDSTRWLSTDRTIGAKRVANEEVEKIRYRHHGRGALDGFVIGLGGGAAVGALIGLADYSDDASLITPDSRIENAAIGAVAFGAVGALLGLPVGGATGHANDYVLVDPGPAPQALARIDADHPAD